MSTETLLIIVVVLILLGGGGWYGSRSLVLTTLVSDKWKRHSLCRSSGDRALTIHCEIAPSLHPPRPR